jgi:hypothetical protein
LRSADVLPIAGVIWALSVINGSFSTVIRRRMIHANATQCSFGFG